MKDYIFADNAATTKLDNDAFEAMKPYLLDEYGNASQPYFFSKSAKAALKAARQTIASCINADEDEIYFTSCGTESNNWAIKGSAFADAEKHATVTSSIEHHAILNTCASIEKLGYPVVYLPVDYYGIVNVKTLEEHLTNKTRLVSIMMANNEIGTIQPIKELCDTAHKFGTLFHTDAVQAVGHIPIDVKKLGVDMLSSSAHKFNGPKGIGFLYVKKGTPLASLIDGGAQEHGMRAGTENIASIVAMATALKINCEQIEENEKHIRSLEKIIIDGLNESGIDYIRNGSNNRIPGNVSLSFKGKDGEAILHRMDLMGIAISTGSACDSVNTQISHVLKAINLHEEYALGTVRISLGKDNTEEETEKIVKNLVKIIK